jgi:hypothetical protein
MKLRITRPVTEVSAFLRDPTVLVSSTFHLKMQKDPVIETVCFLVFRILGNIRNSQTQ